MRIDTEANSLKNHFVIFEQGLGKKSHSAESSPFPNVATFRLEASVSLLQQMDSVVRRSDLCGSDVRADLVGCSRHLQRHLLPVWIRQLQQAE